MRQNFARLSAFHQLPLVCAGMFFMVACASAQTVPKGAVEKMGSDQFKTREQGYEELKKWTNKNLKKAPELLHKTWSKEVDPEVKTRCFSVMKEAVIIRQFGRGPGFIGIRMEQVFLQAQPDEEGIVGVRITLVNEGSPGEKAGLLPGDVITQLDKIDFNEINPQLRDGAVGALIDYIKAKQSGDIVTLHILRAGKKHTLKVTLTKRPPELDREMFGDDPEVKRLRREKFFSEWLEKRSR